MRSVIHFVENTEWPHSFVLANVQKTMEGKLESKLQGGLEKHTSLGESLPPPTFWVITTDGQCPLCMRACWFS